MNEVNTILLEQAHEISEQFLGTGLDVQIEQAIASNDLMRVKELVQQGVDMIQVQEAQLDDFPTDNMTDERAEAMYTEATDVF